MSITRLLVGTTAALLLAAQAPTPAVAQFGGVFPGQVQLPQDDFTWIWGSRRESTMGRAEDFSIAGGEAGFRCTLKGRMSPASGWSMSQIRDLENELRTSLFFIQSSANAMYVLERQLDLDWAMLECAKLQATVDAERAQEQVDKAREKAERRREQRRARQQREAEREDDG